MNASNPQDFKCPICRNALDAVAGPPVPGDRDGTSCSAALSALVGDHFRTRGYSVAFNQPYRGGFITSHHGRPAEHQHAIQIELRRDLYMNETTYEIDDTGFARLSKTIAELLVALREFRP